MNSFTFNGKSSNNILDEELFICEFESIDALPTITREIVKGEVNRYRNVANYFGTKDSETLQLSIGIVKSSGKPFSIEDRDNVEGWLVDNDIPKPLVITDKKGKQSIFFGIVSSYEWRVAGSLVIGLSMIFECDSKYYYEAEEYNFNVQNNSSYVLNNTSKETVTYPVLLVKNMSGTEKVFKIKNSKDNDYFEIKVSSNSTVEIDCSLCMITSGQSYSDLGLEDKNYINWPKLYKGKNQLVCEGSNFEVTIKLKSKKLGLGSYFGDHFSKSYW